MAYANKKVDNEFAKTERGYEDQRHSSSSQPSEIACEGTKDEPTRIPFTHQAKILSHTSISLTYGFYVVMGGLVVDVSDMHDKLIHDSRSHLQAYCTWQGWDSLNTFRIMTFPAKVKRIG